MRKYGSVTHICKGGLAQTIEKFYTGYRKCMIYVTLMERGSGSEQPIMLHMVLHREALIDRPIQPELSERSAT